MFCNSLPNTWNRKTKHAAKLLREYFQAGQAAGLTVETTASPLFHTSTPVLALNTYTNRDTNLRHSCLGTGSIICVRQGVSYTTFSIQNDFLVFLVFPTLFSVQKNAFLVCWSKTIGPQFLKLPISKPLYSLRFYCVFGVSYTTFSTKNGFLVCLSKQIEPQFLKLPIS